MSEQAIKDIAEWVRDNYTEFGAFVMDDDADKSSPFHIFGWNTYSALFYLDSINREWIEDTLKYAASKYTHVFALTWSGQEFKEVAAWRKGEVYYYDIANRSSLCKGTMITIWHKRDFFHLTVDDTAVNYGSTKSLLANWDIEAHGSTGLAHRWKQDQDGGSIDLGWV